MNELDIFILTHINLISITLSKKSKLQYDGRSMKTLTKVLKTHKTVVYITMVLLKRSNGIKIVPRNGKIGIVVTSGM